MKEVENSDVVVVGAGVSGSYLSHLLANSGIDVIIVEKSKDIKLDSGIVSNKIFDFFRIKEGLIKQKIKKMKLNFVSSEFTIKSKKPFAFILDRKNFGINLREKAKDSGARFFYDEITDVKIRDYEIEAIGIEKIYRGKILVGADGANSIIRNYLGISSPKLYLGFMCNYLNSSERNRDVTVYHNKKYSKRFFAWNIEANKEFGLITELYDCNSRINNLLLDIKKENKEMIIKEKYYNLIPSGITRSYGKRSLLLGDACGQVKPLTGGGIIYSLTCARIASEIIKEFIEKNDEKIIKKYGIMWKREIGREIFFQEKLRDLYERLNENDIKKIARRIKDFYFDEIDYDNSISIARRILLKTPKIDLIEIVLLLFKYLLC